MNTFHVQASIWLGKTTCSTCSIGPTFSLDQPFVATRKGLAGSPKAEVFFFLGWFLPRAVFCSGSQHPQHQLGAIGGILIFLLGAVWQVGCVTGWGCMLALIGWQWGVAWGLFGVDLGSAAWSNKSMSNNTPWHLHQQHMHAPWITWTLTIVRATFVVAIPTCDLIPMAIPRSYQLPAERQSKTPKIPTRLSEL